MSHKLKNALLSNQKLILPSDEVIKFTVGYNPSGNIILDFGRDVKCLVLTPDSARQLAEILLSRASRQ